MPESEQIVTVSREWVIKAENDLKTAAHTLKLGGECATDTVCIHAQQCVEKYLKAVLVLHAVEFPKTHDIEKLVYLLPRGVLSSWVLEEQRRLTHYATVTRYPGDYETIPLGEARGAVRIARRVRKEIRSLLPKPVLRRSTK